MDNTAMETKKEQDSAAKVDKSQRGAVEVDPAKHRVTQVIEKKRKKDCCLPASLLMEPCAICTQWMFHPHSM